MAYVVNTTLHAERDLASLYQQVNDEYSDTAMEWYLGIKAAILSLEQRPNRCPINAKEGQAEASALRPQPHVYRVIYRVLGKRSRLRCSTFATAQGEC
jgi:hypothetical protein